MTTREKFYSERDLRSQQFGLGGDFFDKPVRISIGRQCAESPAGQAAALAMVNMATRLHRSIRLEVPSEPLLVRALAGGNAFDDAVVRLGRAVDPFIESGAPKTKEAASVGIGADAPRHLDWYVGAVGGAAIIAREPVPVESGAEPSLAAFFASCLGAMALCRQLLSDPLLRPAEIDVWRWANAGPMTQPTPVGPIDVGDVLVVGAGGVGSCFAYWVSEFGHRGRWAVADGDLAELHNTNRCMGMLPSDAGWPEFSPQNKADIAARHMAASPLPRFYDELTEAEARADLVLPLANDRDVRHLIGQRGEPVLLHATTSPAWEAQLHRHIPDIDDCICCRMPPPRTNPRFKCSTAPTQLPSPDGQSTDAALPFLSGAAGLMLVRGLLLLQHGLLASTQSNLCSFRMRDARGPTAVARFRCRGGCDRTLVRASRALVQRGRKWAAVDAIASRSTS